MVRRKMTAHSFTCMMRALHQKNLSPGRARGDQSPPYANTAGLPFGVCQKVRSAEETPRKEARPARGLQNPTTCRVIFEEKKFFPHNHSPDLYLASQIKSRRRKGRLL